MARALVHIHLHFVHSPMYLVQTIGSGNAPLGADARPVAGVRVWRGDSVGIAVLARSGGTLQHGDNIPRPGGGKSDPRHHGGDAR
jgi:hypothetical protein